MTSISEKKKAPARELRGGVRNGRRKAFRRCGGAAGGRIGVHRCALNRDDLRDLGAGRFSLCHRGAAPLVRRIGALLLCLDRLSRRRTRPVPRHSSWRRSLREYVARASATGDRCRDEFAYRLLRRDRHLREPPRPQNQSVPDIARSRRADVVDRRRHPKFNAPDLLDLHREIDPVGGNTKS